MEPIIRVDHLTHTYSAGTPFQRSAVRDMSLEIRRGEFLGIIGHTGSGKSTLIQHLNGLLKPTEGHICLNGQDIWADPKKIRQVRFQVGLVFQYPESQLFEETVYKAAAFGPKNMGLPQEEIDRRVRASVRAVGLSDEMLEKSPFALSGGQKRRVAIAGVMAMEPEVLILDEPTAGLDPAGCRQILDNICAYREKTGSTVIIVSHNMDDAARLADRIVVFDHGSIVMDGTPEQGFSKPEELSAIGLSIPHAAAIAVALRKRGVQLEGSIYTHEQLKAAVIRAKEAGKC